MKGAKTLLFHDDLAAVAVGSADDADTLAGRADADTLPAARTNDPAPMEGQFTIYHTVLRFLGINAPVYEAEKSIF